MGLTESHFSWYSKLGRCTGCEGRGYIELTQRYGPPVEVQCETCVGARLSSRSLLPRFKGHNLAEVMQMSIEDALGVFGHVKLIESRLARAAQFGLGYVKIGQGMDSLSGGELQRLTLTIELKRSQLAGSWFLLVHPGTGLHAPDIHVLGELMRMMKERGATFFVLENREEFFTYADHLIEF
jgi:excinuclease ABC subunit A